MSLKKLKMLARKQRVKSDVEAPPATVVATEVTVTDVAETPSAHASAPQQPVLTNAWPLPPKPKAKAKKKPALTVALEAVMVEAIKTQFGDGVITKKWSVKERSLAKKLVEAYTLEMTEEVIKRFVEEWPNMMRQSRGRLYGLPTINFLWAAQDRFFGAAQLGQNTGTTPANIDEYQAIEETDDDW